MRGGHPPLYPQVRIKLDRKLTGMHPVWITIISQLFLVFKPSPYLMYLNFHYLSSQLSAKLVCCLNCVLLYVFSLFVPFTLFVQGGFTAEMQCFAILCKRYRTSVSCHCWNSVRHSVFTFFLSWGIVIGIISPGGLSYIHWRRNSIYNIIQT